MPSVLALIARMRRYKNMAKAFFERVKRERVVDIRKYRYILDSTVGKTPCIKRLPKIDLDTTAAIDGWETVTTL